MYRIWPTPDSRPLDDEALTELYAPAPGSVALRVNFVASVDGAVELDGYSAGLGSPADRKVFGLLRMYPHALMVGAGTLRHEGYHAVTLDGARRDWRRARGLDPYPRLIVVSGRLALDPTHPALAEAPVRPIILTHAAAPPDRRTALSAVADVQIYGETEVDLSAAVADLRKQGVAQLLSEGGPHLLGALTAADLVDEVCLTVSPMLAGPGAGRITAGTPSPVRGLALAHVLLAESNLLLRYARSA
jgi:riboflavin biosynthesis pyrimidine reductase